jgi:hypothetical protein
MQPGKCFNRSYFFSSFGLPGVKHGHSGYSCGMVYTALERALHKMKKLSELARGHEWVRLVLNETVPTMKGRLAERAVLSAMQLKGFEGLGIYGTEVQKPSTPEPHWFKEFPDFDLVKVGIASSQSPVSPYFKFIDGVVIVKSATGKGKVKKTVWSIYVVQVTFEEPKGVKKTKTQAFFDSKNLDKGWWPAGPKNNVNWHLVWVTRAKHITKAMKADTTMIHNKNVTRHFTSFADFNEALEPLDKC